MVFFIWKIQNILISSSLRHSVCEGTTLSDIYCKTASRRNRRPALPPHEKCFTSSPASDIWRRKFPADGHRSSAPSTDPSQPRAVCGRIHGDAENAGVENAGADSRGIATDELIR